MEWEDFLAGLPGPDRDDANRIAAEYGRDAAVDHVRYNPVSSAGELETALRRESRRVRTQVVRLFESIDPFQVPPGWTVSNNTQVGPDGTFLATTEVIGPNGGTGFFERGFHQGNCRIELRNAFLRVDPWAEELPSWISGPAVPLVATRGTPTVQYFTLYQLRLLGVPAGRIRWWRWALYRLGLRPGPFAAPGVVSSIKMSTIQNFETIVHLHWLRQRHLHADPDQLLRHTASVVYAETTAVLCGYKVTRVRYLSAGEWEDRIGRLMEHFEGGNPDRQAENDRLLSRYSFDRNTVMRQNFGIELDIMPAR